MKAHGHCKWPTERTRKAGPSEDAIHARCSGCNPLIVSAVGKEGGSKGEGRNEGQDTRDKKGACRPVRLVPRSAHPAFNLLRVASWRQIAFSDRVGRGIPTSPCFVCAVHPVRSAFLFAPCSCQVERGRKLRKGRGREG